MATRITFDGSAPLCFQGREDGGRGRQGFDETLESAKKDSRLREQLVAVLPMAFALDACRQERLRLLRARLQSLSGQISRAGSGARASELQKQGAVIGAEITEIDSRSRKLAARIAAAKAAGVLTNLTALNVRNGVRFTTASA